MTERDIVSLLRRAKLPCSTEARLQVAIGNALVGAGLSFSPEHRLGPGERIDFLVAGGIGIEAKTRYARRRIFRQLERYAEHAEIAALILVTGTAMGLPAAINGKPLYYVSLGKGGL